MNEQKRTRFVSAVPVEEPMILGEIRVFRGPSAAFPPVGKPRTPYSSRLHRTQGSLETTQEGK